MSVISWVSAVEGCPLSGVPLYHDSRGVLYTSYVAGTTCNVLIREVSLIRRSSIKRFHCTLKDKNPKSHPPKDSQDLVPALQYCIILCPHRLVSAPRLFRGIQG